MARRLLSTLFEYATIIAGMSGLFLARLNRCRLIVTIAIGASWIALAALGFRPGLCPSLIILGALFAVRYLILFTSFLRRGIAHTLKTRFGTERGYSIYEAVTAFFFWARGMSFVWLLDASRIDMGHLASQWSWFLGAGFSIVGVVINVWATRVVGMDTYYYRDLFVGDSETDFKLTGPYRIWRNPMYGVGQFAAYGAALMVPSPLGLLATGLNQLAMYVFNWTIEQPHMERVVARSTNRASGILP